MGRSNRPQAVSCVVGGLIAWDRRSKLPGQSEQFFSSLLHSRVALLHWFRGSSLWCSSFGSVVCALFLSMVFVSDVSSRCPCLRGPRLVFFK
jgi:hypothetical protein